MFLSVTVTVRLHSQPSCSLSERDTTARRAQLLALRLTPSTLHQAIAQYLFRLLAGFDLFFFFFFFFFAEAFRWISHSHQSPIVACECFDQRLPLLHRISQYFFVFGSFIANRPALSTPADVQCCCVMQSARPSGYDNIFRAVICETRQRPRRLQDY